MTNPNRVMPMLVGRAMLQPKTFNKETRTIDVVFATEARVRRWDEIHGEFDEILAIEDSAIRWERINKGLSVLDSHHRWHLRNILGVSIKGWTKDGEAIATIQFSERAEIADLIKDIEQGIIRNISVGYNVHRYQEVTEEGGFQTFRAIDWEPCEISFVPVPADFNSQIRSKGETSTNCEFILKGESLGKRAETEEKETKTEEISEETKAELKKELKEELKKELKEELKNDDADEEEETTGDKDDEREDDEEEKGERSLVIIKACREAGLGIDYAQGLIEKKVSVSEARKQIINKLAGERSHMTNNTHVSIVADEKDKKRSLIEKAVSVKAGLETSTENEVHQMRNLSLVEMAKELNPALRTMSRREVALRALHVTGDFPHIFGNVANKSLRKGYEAAPRTFLPFSRQVELSDYKEVTRIQLHSAPELERIAEGGEYTFGTFGEGAEKYRLSKFGRKIRLTEEMFVNDDLDALSRLPAMFGSSANRLESKLVYGLLTGSHKMSDGKELFHADHLNLGAPGARISEASLEAMFKAMAGQKAGIDPLNIIPKFLVVGLHERVNAMKLMAALTATKSGDVNVFQDAFQVIWDANITGTNWFAAASPDQIDTIEYAYLEGMVGPEVRAFAKEEDDCVVLKCKHVFATKAVDHRGLYKNAGAN